MLIDSHCHLDFPELAGDEAGVLARARSAGVAGMLTIGTRLDQFDKVRAIAERHANIWCSVGVHPHEAKEEGQRTPDRLVAATRHPKVIGIGETGLDFYYEHSPRAEQAESFRAHIAAARATGLPLVIHTRDADEACGRILEDEMAKGAFRAVLHCYTGGRELAMKAIALGLSISFTGILTFKKSQALRDLAAERRRFGYRRLGVLLQREGLAMNKKKLFRLYREEGLVLRSRRPRCRKTAVNREARYQASVLMMPGAWISCMTN